MTASFRRLPPAGLLWATLAAWLAASPPAGARSAEWTDAPAREAAGKWAQDLFLALYQSPHRATTGGKLALQPPAPLATGLSDRHRWQVYNWMVSALQEAARERTVVDRARVEESYRAMEQSGSNSNAVMDRYLEVLRKQGARINVTCRSNAFRGGRIVLDCSATDIETNALLGQASVSFRENWLPLLSLDYALNAVAGKVAKKLRGPLGKGWARVVGPAGGETRLSKYVAQTLVTEISGRMGKHPGWRGVDAGPEGAVHRLEGKLLRLDERKLEFQMRLLLGDKVDYGIREYVALSSVPAGLLERATRAGPGRVCRGVACGSGLGVP